jgi:uncharacterized protein YdiU (UPF0061 family)
MSRFKEFIDKNVWKLEQTEKDIVSNHGVKNVSHVPLDMTSNITTTPTTLLDPEYLDHLYKFVESNNIQGPDYFEFASTLNELKSLSPDIPEENLYKMTYVGFKTQGVTLQYIIDSAEQYTYLLDKHKQNFESHLNEEYQKNIGVKEKEIDDLNNKNRENQKTIDTLLLKIEEIKQDYHQNTLKISENEQHIRQEKNRLMTKRDKFELAFNTVINKIKSDIIKMKTHVTFKIENQ